MRYKFAFQWCDGQGEPWWLIPPYMELGDLKGCSQSIQAEGDQSSVLVASVDSGLPPKEESPYKCPLCDAESVRLYITQVCLNPTCCAFFAAQLQHAPPNLVYDPAFLRLSTATFQLPPIEPELPATSYCHPKDQPLDWEALKLLSGTAKRFLRGWHCSACGRLSSRWRWKCWSCSTEGCGVIYGPHASSC